MIHRKISEKEKNVLYTSTYKRRLNTSDIRDGSEIFGIEKIRDGFECLRYKRRFRKFTDERIFKPFQFDNQVLIDETDILIGEIYNRSTLCDIVSANLQNLALQETVQKFSAEYKHRESISASKGRYSDAPTECFRLVFAESVS